MVLWEIMPVFLLLLFSVALSTGMVIIVLVCRRARRQSAGAGPTDLSDQQEGATFEKSWLFRRPACWLAVKSRSLVAVQSALGVNNPKPCSWFDGMTGEPKLFIAPPVNGWVLVLGSGLPDPFEDVDACFRFMIELSRKLGHVQLFSANRVLHYHAWVKAERGRIQRGYAWAGKTLWQQGQRTSAETELDLRCIDYAETVEASFAGAPDPATVNTDKVPMLAARWSLDPARIDARLLETECGIAGEPSRRY
jgi:hypothetical protein